VLALVLGRDRNVNVAHGWVSVTEWDDRNVSNCCFLNWLQQTPNQHISKYSPCVHTLSWMIVQSQHECQKTIAYIVENWNCHLISVLGSVEINSRAHWKYFAADWWRY
jgi:hypothetical protein